jgi:hypothetical protein
MIRQVWISAKWFGYDSAPTPLCRVFDSLGSVRNAYGRTQAKNASVRAMKAAVHCVLFSLVALTGCQSRSPNLTNAAPGQAQSAGIEFKRPSRVYEQGDALFAVMNNSTRVLWFEGRGPEEPAYRLKVGASTGPDQNTPVPGPSGVAERFPLLPGNSCYFEINASNAAGQSASVGVTFYPSRTSTDGFTIWSPAVVLPANRR